MPTKTATKSPPTYDASKLQLVEGIEHVRRRPGMYIGSTGPKGLHHLIEEIVANSVDEAMAGHCTEIVVEIDDDNWVTVSDNARGIPVDIHPETGLSGLELVLTKLGGGGKWGDEDGGYKVSGGLHGVGASVVNAVSEQMKALVCREGFEWTQTFKRGVPTGQIKKGKKTKATGTTIAWKHDTTIFDASIKYDRSVIEHRLRELSYLNPGLKFILKFHGQADETFYSEAGLSDYMKYLVASREGVSAVHKQPIVLQGEIEEELQRDGKTITDKTVIDIALYWTTAQNELPHMFVNSINTFEGGTHYDGLRSGLRKSVNEAAEELGKFRARDPKFEQADTREGLFLAISVRVGNPQFESQTKIKLGNTEVQRRVDAFVADRLRQFLLAKENRDAADSIINRVIEARDGRLAASRARSGVKERKGLLGGSGLPGKLADCSSKNREETEIFLVEGDSAGGGMKQTRDRATQAILPLRGKIANAEKSGDSTLSSDAVKDILAALGGTITDIKVPVKRGNKVINKTKLIVDLSEPRYGKIICAADADVDGGHIVTLLMTFFFRYAPNIIREGRLYIAQLPLYRVEHKKLGRLYLFTDEELQAYTKKNELKNRADGTPDISRFKGLGEMQPEQLRELALNPQTRRLRRIIIDDVSEADNMTTLLMGSRVNPRREYIQEHALDVEADI